MCPSIAHNQNIFCNHIKFKLYHIYSFLSLEPLMICFKIAKIIIDVNDVNIVHILNKQKKEDKNALKRHVLYIKWRCKMG